MTQNNQIHALDAADGATLWNESASLGQAGVEAQGRVGGVEAQNVRRLVDHRVGRFDLLLAHHVSPWVVAVDGFMTCSHALIVPQNHAVVQVAVLVFT